MSQVISVVLRMCTQIEVDRKGVHASGELGIAQPVKGKYENRVLIPQNLPKNARPGSLCL